MNKEKVIEILKDYAYFEDDDCGGYFRYIDFSQKALIPLGILEILNYIEDLEKKAELGEHYKHLYSSVKKQKGDVVEYIKNNAEEYKWEDDDGAINKDYCCEGTIILRMLGEIDVEDNKTRKKMKYNDLYIHKCAECKTKFIYDVKEDTTINGLRDLRRVIQCPNCENYGLIENYWGITDKKYKKYDLVNKVGEIDVEN